MDNMQIIEHLKKENYYLDIRELEDGTIVGIADLLYTRAIFFDMSLTGFSQRFCFSDKELANKEFQKLKNMDSEPEGYIARR